MRRRTTKEPHGQILQIAVALLALGSGLLLLSFALAILPSLRGFGPTLRMPVPWLLAAGLLLLVVYAAIKPSAETPLRERDEPLFGHSTDFVSRLDESPARRTPDPERPAEAPTRPDPG